MANDIDATIEVSISGFGNGSVRFEKGTKGRKESVEIKGETTIRNAAIAPTPSFFDVGFTIGVHLASDGAQTHSTLLLQVPVPSETASRSYSDVEDEAARSLPSMLRDLADLVEADIERVHKERQQEQPD